MALESFLVAAATPTTLAGGAPAAPGEVVRVDPTPNARAIRAGELVRLTAPSQTTQRRRRTTKKES